MNEQGTGSPAVILESGIAATSLSWAFVQPRLAVLTQVMSYDRAGLGWSTPSNKPRNIEQMMDDLRGLLLCADIAPPYILVGHSFGGLLIRSFAHFFAWEVAGLVLVDPVSVRSWANCDETQRKRLALGIRLSRRGAHLARLGVVRLALNVLLRAGTLFPKLVAKTTAGQAAGFLDRIAGEVRRLRPELWPAVIAHWSRPKSFQAMAEHLECLESSARFASSVSIPAHLPVTVLSASTATLSELQERDEWVSTSARGRHILLENCGHWIQLENPDAVVDAVSDLVKLLREFRDPAASY